MLLSTAADDENLMHIQYRTNDLILVIEDKDY